MAGENDLPAEREVHATWVLTGRTANGWSPPTRTRRPGNTWPPTPTVITGQSGQRENRAMSQYLILIYHDEEAAAEFERARPGVTTAAHRSFMERNRGGHPRWQCVAAHGHRHHRPPGPGRELHRHRRAFAETKEALGGYYLIEAADLDDALGVAKRVPGSSGVEVRPVTRSAERRATGARGDRGGRRRPPVRVGLRAGRDGRVAGDIDLAEECVQDAYARALDTWARDAGCRPTRRPG